MPVIAKVALVAETENQKDKFIFETGPARFEFLATSKNEPEVSTEPYLIWQQLLNSVMIHRQVNLKCVSQKTHANCRWFAMQGYLHD